MPPHLYVQLDASYSDDPKIIEAGEQAELLYLRSLCLVKRILSDGFVADANLSRFCLTNVKTRAKKLVDVGLWLRDDNRGGYVIATWLRHNPSAAEVAEISEKRRLAGRKGGRPRKQDALQDEKQSGLASGNHDALANGNQVAIQPEKQGVNPETETEKQTETEPPTPGGEEANAFIETIAAQLLEEGFVQSDIEFPLTALHGELKTNPDRIESPIGWTRARATKARDQRLAAEKAAEPKEIPLADGTVHVIPGRSA